MKHIFIILKFKANNSLFLSNLSFVLGTLQCSARPETLNYNIYLFINDEILKRKMSLQHLFFL